MSYYIIYVISFIINFDECWIILEIVISILLKGNSYNIYLIIYSKDNKYIVKRCLYFIWNWCLYVWRILRFNYNGKRWNIVYV